MINDVISQYGIEKESIDSFSLFNEPEIRHYYNQSIYKNAIREN